jgi:glutathione synthase/RimK-type ligase-like ATP-grasp enzyme
MISLVTAREAAGLDSDLPLLVDALTALGEPSEVTVWDDPTVDWGRFDLVVVRSTWDYFRDRDRFCRWADRVDSVTHLVNPAPVLRWNTDKHYLREVALAGWATVPTTFVAPGDDVTGPVLERVAHGGAVVVKPAISAGSNDTARYGPGEVEAAAEHVRVLTAAGRVAMVQPYQANIDEHGETGLVYVAGRFSHAFRKAALLTGELDVAGGLYAREEIGPAVATAAERALGDAIVDWLARRFHDLVLARIDLVPGPNGPLVLEVELTEPSLFLHTDAAAPARVAAALRTARLAGRPR